MISIITAVYNQLAINQLYFESLKQYTHHPFELIVIDNGSTDGSREYFESVGAKVIANDGNYSYPRCQNQGIAVAQYDYLAFLNNDLIVSRNWDKYLVESMQHNGLEIITTCGIEHLETPIATKHIKRRWQRIKNLIGLFGHSRTTFRLMHRLMYKGQWETFTEERHQRFQYQVKEGFVGNTVMIHRTALDKVGLWDERIQGADFDLYLRAKERSETVGDIKPMHIALDAFNHHYIRITLKSGYPPFKDKANLIEVEQKWPAKKRAWLEQINGTR